MKTDTKTVILFLEKTDNTSNNKLKERIHNFFTDAHHNDFSWENLEESISMFANECRGITLKEYIEDIDNPDIKKSLEIEQIYTYIKTKQQRVVVVDAGSKQEAKDFLGYDFTTRRGKEGIQEKYIDSNDYEIDSKLFSNQDLLTNKVNYYIYHNFFKKGDDGYKDELLVDSSLSKNMQICQLSDLIPFENDKDTFNSFIFMNKIELDKCLLISSIYPVHPLRTILPKSVKKGTSITKDKTIKGTIPVVAGGRDPAYYHNVHNRESGVITVSASGAGAGFVNYYDEPIFASDCNTIQCDDKTLLKYVYYILQWKQQDIYKFARGNAQPHIYEPQIYKFLIPIPEDENIIKSVVEKCQEVDSVKNSKDEYKLSEKRKIIDEMLGMDI